MNLLVPSIIGGAKVLAYTPIDGRHGATKRAKRVIAGDRGGAAAGLAICRYENDPGFYLFGCDEKWRCITDTWHLSLEEAKSQAELEYPGTSETWLDTR